MPLITVQYSSTKEIPPAKAEIAAAVSELSSEGYRDHRAGGRGV